MTALLGTFVKLGTMADGTPRITLDLQCTLAEVAALGLMPGVAFGIARITGESTVAVPEPEPEKVKPGQLCIMACNFSKSKEFQQWSGTSSEAEARQFILDACDAERRIDLDFSKNAGEKFHNFIRGPFLNWKAA